MKRLNKNVTMMPDYRPGAYYQSQLVKALNHEGFKITFPEERKKFPSLFPVFRTMLKTKTTILHMHWIDKYSGFRSRNMIISLIKSILYIIDVYLTKLILKTKMIWTIHNKYSHECIHPRIEKIIRKVFSNKVNEIICHCNQAKKEITKEFGTPQNKINVIPLGNYLNKYKNQISKEDALNYLNLNSEDFIFLNFGVIRPYKGINYLIRSFKAIRRNKNIKLMIIGRPLNVQIKENISKNIKESKDIIYQFNFIHDDNVQIYFNASNVVVFSFQKILGSAGILLAMSFGKPIIAPRLGCITEILDDKGAFLYNPLEKQGLLNALEKALENKEDLKQMGQYNLDLANSFGWDKIGTETKKVYEKLLLNQKHSNKSEIEILSKSRKNK